MACWLLDPGPGFPALRLLPLPEVGGVPGRALAHGLALSVYLDTTCTTASCVVPTSVLRGPVARP